MPRSRGRRAPRALAAFLAGAALAVVSCSATGGSAIRTSGAWARTSMAMAQAGAAYLVIENTGSAADALLGGTTPVAGTVEVHETVDMASAEPGASAGMGGGSMLGMQKVDRLEIPAGGTVELKPGGYHLMLIGLTQELKAGTSIELTLRFEKAGDVKVTAEVRAN